MWVLSFLASLWAGTTLAQPEFTWAKQGAGGDYDEARGIAVDQLGNCYLTGLSQSPTFTIGGITLTNQGSNAIVVAKLASTGIALWARSYGQVVAGAGASRGLGAAAGTNGDCFITGEWYGTVAFGQTNLSSSGLADMFVARHDAVGNLLWVQTAGGVGISNRAAGYRIAAEPGGNTAVAGDFLGNVQLSSAAGTNATLSGQGAFLAKYDPLGNLLWVRQISGDTYPYGVAVDAVGNLSLAADFASTNVTLGGVTLTNRGLVNGFVAKFSPTGVLLWTRQVGGSEGDWPLGMAADRAGNVYLACYVSSADLAINGLPFGGGDHLLAKFTADGSVAWAKSTPLFGRIAVDQAGQVHMTWEFSEPVMFGSYVLTNAAASQDIFVAKFDASGNPLWAKRAGGSAQDVPRDIALDDQADVYLAGGFQAVALFDTLSLTNSGLGGADLFVARINAGPPVLRIGRLVGAARITWPASTVGYHLEGSPAIAPGPWQVVTNVPEIAGTDYAVVVTNTVGNRFFRLKSP